VTRQSPSARVALAVAFLVVCAQPATAQDQAFAKAAQAFRAAKQAVQPVSENTIVCEAEEFQSDRPGWQAKPFGTNYFAATFANAFLSRQAYLGAPEQCDDAAASILVQVPKTGKYLALIRYECCYRFETQFRLKVEQGGQVKLDRLYGARDNVKIWAFRNKLKKEVAWPWGAGENVVWEGHDAYVDLTEGPAKLTLSAGKQPTPAAQRNVDLVMLTSDLAQVEMRIEKENYLPLDGMLTQAGDVYVKVHNAKDGGDLALTLPAGTEHSPYWIHLRTWKPKTIAAKPGESTDWIEVGSLLDTLSDGQWNLTAKSKGAVKFDLEFGLKNADGKIETIRRFKDVSGNVSLAYDGATRYSHRIRLADEVLYDLVNYLKKYPVKGAAPKRTLIYGYTFGPKAGDAKYTAALNDFMKLMGATAMGRNEVEDVNASGLVKGYIDVRSVPTPKLEDYCKKLQAEGRADKIAVVSLGDEIGLAKPSPKDHAGFRAWLKSQNVKPSDVDPVAGDDLEKVMYSPDPKATKDKPGLYYYSQIYSFRFGIKNLKDRTDILKKYLPNAGIGANFSPHHHHMYLGDTHHWISVFREDGMTMPWGEDYIFQVPVGSQQMNFIMVDMFRAAIRNKPGAKIHYYVMAHAPNNTPKSWRRQFYGDLGHGAKVINLFEFRPVQHAYTENHVNAPAMYQEVRKSFHELGTFEDIIQDGTVRAADVGLWCSETADVWRNHRSPFDAAKRCLYSAIRHQQVPLDFVVDGDDLKPYKVLFLCDANVSRAGAKAISDWVKAGGRLVATAGAGMFDELNQPNKVLRELLGVDQKALEDAPGEPIVFEKQDLPFAKPLDTVTMLADKATIPAYGVRSVVKTNPSATIVGKFSDGSPALTVREAGKGVASYCAFLPGLSYFAPAMPKRPMDRGATDESMTHFLAHDFDAKASALIGDLVHVKGPVRCEGKTLVESCIVQAKNGVVIPLINWHPEAAKGLKVTIDLSAPTKNVSLASGSPVTIKRQDGKLVCTLDLEVADALILR